MPQPQQCMMQAVSVTYTTAPSKARSPTHWARPGIEPASTCILVGFVSTALQWELPHFSSPNKLECPPQHYLRSCEYSKLWKLSLICIPHNTGQRFILGKIYFLEEFLKSSSSKEVILSSSLKKKKSFQWLNKRNILKQCRIICQHHALYFFIFKVLLKYSCFTRLL